MTQVEASNSPVWTQAFWHLQRDSEESIRHILDELDASDQERSREEIWRACVYHFQPGDFRPLKPRLARRLPSANLICSETTCAVNVSILQDYIRFRLFSTARSKKDTVGWRIQESFGGIDISQFQAIFGSWPEVTSARPRSKFNSSSAADALDGRGRYCTLRALSIDNDDFHKWCNFGEFDEISSGAAIQRSASPLVKRLLCRLEVSFVVDMTKRRGQQIQLKTFSTIGSYGPVGNLLIHNCVDKFTPDHHLPWKAYCDVHYPDSAAPPDTWQQQQPEQDAAMADSAGVPDWGNYVQTMFL